MINAFVTDIRISFPTTVQAFAKRNFATVDAKSNAYRRLAIPLIVNPNLNMLS